MMKITYHAPGNAMLEFEATDEKKAIESLSFWQTLPQSCPTCGAPVHFFFRSPQDNNYYGLVCEGSPAHETNFGQYRTGGGLYYKGDWKPVYGASEQSREINDASLIEPEAELNRLREEMKKEWHSKSRNQSLDGAIRERFGVSLDRLRINQLREILERMRNPEKAKR